MKNYLRGVVPNVFIGDPDPDSSGFPLKACGYDGLREGPVVHEIYSKRQPENPLAMRIGHPTGTLQVEIEIEEENGQLELTKPAWLARAARLLMDGNVFGR